ncbi:MAG: DUF5752 family protein [Candidatus Bathyarchaeota archaeon]|nr:DUF5752 family protein [Candidatus Bathyarchaeota archaeon]
MITQENETKDSSTILRTVPFESGFHFRTEQGTYTGLTATSLQDFASKLNDVEDESVSYHYYRGDFQRWIEDTLGDKEFADSLCFIDRDISVSELKAELLKLLDKRITELEGLKWVETEGI